MKRDKKYLRKPSEENLEKGGFDLPWQFYLFICLYWVAMFNGFGGYSKLTLFVSIIASPVAFILTIIFFHEITDFFGIRKTKSVSTVVKKDATDSVYIYTEPSTQTIYKESDLDSTKKSKSPISIVAEKILPPESFFSVPRKIDWDALNKTRKHHGDLGEMFVYDLEKNYLTKVGRSDLAEKVRHVASEGDGHGYDIQSFNKDGSKKFIEVKATNSSTGSSFNISKNEFSFLQNNLSSAVVYHVHNVNNERETTVVVYPAGEVLNSPNISPSGYVVKM
jgi:hypothetical protein